jgi:hypothetical protein
MSHEPEKTKILSSFKKKFGFFHEKPKKEIFLMNFQTFKPFAPEEDFQKPFKLEQMLFVLT